MTAPHDCAPAGGSARGAGTYDDTTPDRTTIYAIVDRRERDRRMRIVAEYVDPDHAIAACRLMRWAGSARHVVLITAIRDEVATP